MQWSSASPNPVFHSQEWIGMDEMSPGGLKLLLENVEQHRAMWVLPASPASAQPGP
jgi:hypothetical protein